MLEGEFDSLTDDILGNLSMVSSIVLSNNTVTYNTTFYNFLGYNPEILVQIQGSPLVHPGARRM